MDSVWRALGFVGAGMFFSSIVIAIITVSAGLWILPSTVVTMFVGAVMMVAGIVGHHGQARE